MSPPRHYRAPQENGGRLIEPHELELGRTLQEHRAATAQWRFELGGRDIQHLRYLARRDLISSAIDHTSSYRPVTGDVPFEAPLILSGHQPEIFHPGVWFKNFLLSRVAKRTNAVAINLIIDHDTLQQPSIAAPTGSLEIPRLENVPFDAALEARPFEERSVVDGTLAASFVERTLDAIAPLRASSPDWNGSLVLETLWPRVLKQIEVHGRWGLALAAARHRLEGEWGLSTLEVPASRIWDSEPFHWVLACFFNDLARLHSLYNQALAEYRIANGLKSSRHPMPDLERDADWIEAPCWYWSVSRPWRERVFVRRAGEQLEWRAGSTEGKLRLDGGAMGMAEQLATRRAAGSKFRPRALLTTLYSRLFLGDLFIHGIGGAKYDEVTDRIIEHYFHVVPPAFVAATATLRLPIPYPHASQAEIVDLRRQLRDLAWHGERRPEAMQSAAAKTKRQLLTAMPPKGQRAEWHDAVSAVNQELARLLDDQRITLEAAIAEKTEEIRRARLLGSREFSFCLFPEGDLRSALS